jgi:hypothetical protein
VSGQDTCSTLRSFYVEEPDQLTLSDSTVPTACQDSNGQAIVSASGGHAPYDHYWSTGDTGTSVSGLPLGTYSVNVIDSNGCSLSRTVGISESGGPSIQLDSLRHAKCGKTNGAIHLSTSGGTAPYSYEWPGLGMTTEDVSGLPEGDYSVIVTDTAGTGCSSSESFTIEQEEPKDFPTCLLVTVDTASGQNVLAWEKEGTQALSHYNIYRETSQSGTYQMIGSVPYDSLSIFRDDVSEPEEKSWKYQIGAVDTCGEESITSAAHKSMHLNVSMDSTGDVNLSWDEYDGFAYKYHIVKRYAASTGGWRVLDSVSSDLTTFVDTSAPNDSLAYNVEVSHPTGGCFSTRAKEYVNTISNSVGIMGPDGYRRDGKFRRSGGLSQPESRTFHRPFRGCFDRRGDDPHRSGYAWATGL